MPAVAVATPRNSIACSCPDDRVAVTLRKYIAEQLNNVERLRSDDLRSMYLDQARGAVHLAYRALAIAREEFSALCEQINTVDDRGRQ